MDQELIPPKKHAGGRPTKYTEDMPQKVVEYVYKQTCLGNIATRCGLCLHLDLVLDTLIEYEKLYPRFFYALSLMRSAKEEGLIQRMLKGKIPFIPAMFLLKNHHGYRDQQDIAHTLGEKQTMVVNGKEVEF